MPDDRIYDCINVFKYSPTGQGVRQISGPPAYRQRYNQLVRDVTQELWRLWQQDEIGFADLPWGSSILFGDSLRRIGYNIRINNRLEPTRRASDYGNGQNQEKVAATSLIMIHEATHLIRDYNLVEEETLCRSLQLLYYQDLLAPQNYTSRVTGTRCTAQLLPNSDEAQHITQEYNRRLQWYQKGQLVDYVVNNTSSYRSSLTAQWVERSIGWWGGIHNRWLTTRGYYLRALATSGSRANASLLLEILESFRAPGQWQTARRAVGSMEQLRQALAANHSLYDIPFSRRVQAVQQTTGEDFGMQPSP